MLNHHFQAEQESDHSLIAKSLLCRNHRRKSLQNCQSWNGLLHISILNFKTINITMKHWHCLYWATYYMWKRVTVKPSINETMFWHCVIGFYNNICYCAFCWLSLFITHMLYRKCAWNPIKICLYSLGKITWKNEAVCSGKFKFYIQVLW